MAEVPEIFPQSEIDDVYDAFDPYDDIALVDPAQEEPLPYGFTWKYNFDKGDLDFSNGDPPVLSSIGTVNEWILHSINTERFESFLLGENVGTLINSLFGSVIDQYILARIRQELVKLVEAHDRIQEVEYVSAFSLKNSVYAFMTYNTDDGVNGQAILQLR